jgi:hypothetical protein
MAWALLVQAPSDDIAISMPSFPNFCMSSGAMIIPLGCAA